MYRSRHASTDGSSPAMAQREATPGAVGHGDFSPGGPAPFSSAEMAAGQPPPWPLREPRCPWVGGDSGSPGVSPPGAYPETP